MALNYREEMALTAAFLKQMRLRLSDKATDALPPEGKHYDSVEPNKQSLVGCLGPKPDPDYTGPQPPNSIGMVLLVSPDAQGNLTCSLSGQFDVVHRYIPDLSNMQRDLVLDSGVPRHGQLISMAFQRYTMTFTGITLAFNASKPIEWVSGKADMTAILQDENRRLQKDPRVMRRCQTNPRGGAKFNFEWSEAALATQEGLNKAVYSQIIDKPDEVLNYQVNVRGRLRPAPAAFGEGMAGRYLLEIFLENQTTTDEAKPFGVEFPYLLDARLAAEIVAGECHKVPHRLQPEDYRYRDDDGLPGYGINCAVKEQEPKHFITDGMPTHEQARVDAPLPDTVGMRHPPHYAVLASDPLPVLDDFLASLDAYLGLWAERIAKLESAGLMADRDVAIADRNAFQLEIHRIKDGVDLIRKDDQLRKCFQWMNEAMGSAIKLQGKKFAGWHLFQIGFILTQVRSIYERHASTAEVRGSMEIADVLWFATGGGKTEAYLGIISMAMLYGRLNHRDYGTTAWMRFPLRMLSVQQFQRLSYVLAQTNQIRQREGMGGWPFTIGYYTGNGTPNRISSTYGDDAYNGFLPAISQEKLKNYQFISDCPYCGIHGSITVKKDLERARIMHVCGNKSCWSNTEAEAGNHGEGIRGEIGIYVSDEECYRYLPTVLVGTVDKLAVIGHNKRFANFFGGAPFYCPEHGFSNDSKCEHRRIINKNDAWEAKECGNNTRTTALKVVPVGQMKDPGFPLLVQDELHLLRESLGNFDAHYETLLNTLQISHKGRAPKVLAATATIKDFEDHINHLYLKNGVRFPAPGVTQGESFYARKATDNGTGLIRRWFAGILPIGRGKVAMMAVAEVSSRFLDQVDEWRDKLANSDVTLMEEMGLGPARAQDALDHIEKNLNTDLVYANSKRNITEVMRYMEEVNGKANVERQFRLLDGDTRLDMILDAIHHVETKGADDTCRHLIATSVVSHGVDIAELNFMVMAGWPKSTAEYIQASARSGRVHPGIVICVLSSQQLFETGVFMNFGDYHNFLDRLVDSVPINRFAPNILERTLPGVISSVLLNWAPKQTWGNHLNNKVKPLVDALRLPNGAGGGIAKEIKKVVVNSLRVPAAIESKFDPRVISGFNASLNDQIDNAFFELENWPGSKNDQTLSEALGDIFGHAPFRSFRDIENQIEIKSSNATADNVLTALAR